MNSDINISSTAFSLMRQYIENNCGIYIEEGKEYLIETRLLKLLINSGCSNFEEFYSFIQSGRDTGINEKMIDAITTNETFWFRDKGPWEILEQVLMPMYIDHIRQNKCAKIRIWSAACSTGQEPYSIAMCIHNYIKSRDIRDVDINKFEIIATDISNAVLAVAETGRYDSISIMRGMRENYKYSYFKQNGRVWSINEEIKNMVTFKKFNLQNDFDSLGNFNLIFCRYVNIYFSHNLKENVLSKIAKALNEKGILMLGNSELFLDYSLNFEVEKFENYQYYKVKR